MFPLSLTGYLCSTLAKPSIQLQLLRICTCMFSSDQYHIISSLCRPPVILCASFEVFADCQTSAALTPNNYCEIAKYSNLKRFNLIKRSARAAAEKLIPLGRVASPEQLWRLRWRINTSSVRCMGIDGAVMQSARSLCVNAACLHYNFTPYLLPPFEGEREWPKVFGWAAVVRL